ncbi:MAG: hypothetical protein U9R19_00405, partial [Bacteroidota bacterium]|nr:hypothetical protein [Bacteroidota bacterium]
MKKKLLLILNLLCISAILLAQDPQFEWVKGIGSTSFDEGKGVTVDDAGNVYTVGSYSGIVDFDPGPGVYNLNAALDGEIFIMKMDAFGNFVWAKALGISNDFGNAICIDNSCNVYVTGQFGGGAEDFDPGAGTYYLSSNGSWDAFILKLDSNGNFVWAKSFGGSSLDSGNCIKIDNNGNIYTIGKYVNTVDFNPGPGVYNITSNSSSTDVFLLKLNSSGNFVWAKSFGGNGLDIGQSIAINSSGDIFGAGTFENTVDFNPGSGTYNLTSNGDYDIFIFKLNSSGNFQWAGGIGGSGIDMCNSIDLDNSSNVYATGYYYGIVDFNPGSATNNLSVSAGACHDIYILKLNSSGNYIWAKSVGGSGCDYGNSISIDSHGDVYTTGTFIGTADFDPGSGISNLTSIYFWDTYILKLNASGSFDWAKMIGGANSHNMAYSMATDVSDNIYLTGRYGETVDFDPGSGVVNLVSNGESDVFVVKLSQPIANASLNSDIAKNTTATPTYYNLTHNYSTWGAVGIRTNDIGTSNWSMKFYDSDDFLNEVEISATISPVDFVVFDQHHLSNTTRGVKAYRYSGTGNARTEFEGYNETLTVGTTTIHPWTANDVVEIWDVYLTPGVYEFTMDYNSGSANLDMALFSSFGGQYYQNRGDYIAHSTQSGISDKSFYISIANSDHYGFVVWANDANSANVDILVETVSGGIWEGDVSTNWNTAGNWNDNTVPISTTDVVIPSGTTYSPYINSVNAYANSLTVHSGATLTIGLYDLEVENDVVIYGTIAMDHNNADLYCDGDIFWEPGSQANITANAEFRVYGNWNFQSGANVQLDNGKVWFKGTTTKYIRSYDDDCYFHNVISDKSGGAYIAVSGYSTDDLLINGDITISSGSILNIFSSEKIILNGSLNNNGGHFHCFDGTFEFAGNPGNLEPNQGDFFNNLIINVPTDVDLVGTYTDTLKIKGDLTIENGMFDSNNHIIEIGGNWNNTAGLSAFLERQGKVIFTTSSGNQYCYGETFYNVTKPSDGNILFFNGQTIINNNFYCNEHVYANTNLYIDNLFLTSTGQLTANPLSAITIYDLDMGSPSGYGTIYADGGQITVSDLVEDGLYGTFMVSDSTGLLDITQGTSSGNYIDLNGTINISGGTMNVHGGFMTSYWPFADNANIVMSGGVLDFTDVSIRVHNSPSWDLSTDITGGVIRTDNSFLVYDDFSPAGGTVEFYGSGNSNLTMNNPGSALHNLHVYKTSDYVNCNSQTATISNNIIIDGGILVSSDTLYVGGDWTNNVGATSFLEGNNVVCFYGTNTGDIITNETYYDIVIDKNVPGFVDLELLPGLQVNILNDLHPVNGTFELNDSTTVDINNDLIIENGAGFNVNDASTTVYLAGDFTDHNNTISSYLGFRADISNTLIFDGNSNAQDFDVSTAEIILGHVTIDKAGANSYVTFNDDVRLKGDLNVIDGWWDSASGKDYFFEGDIDISASGAWFPFLDQSTCYFEGHTNQEFNYPGYTNAFSFSNIVINSTYSSDGLNLNSTLRLHSGCNIEINNGHLWANSQEIIIEGDIDINNNGVLDLDDNSELNIGNFGVLNINLGGILSAIGSENNEAVIESGDATYYQFNCNSGGTISAEWASFADMDQWGVYIYNGGLVDVSHSFHHCTFLPGETNGTLLVVNGSQTFTVEYANFPNQGSSSHNVRKPDNLG